MLLRFCKPIPMPAIKVGLGTEKPDKSHPFQTACQGANGFRPMYARREIAGIVHTVRAEGVFLVAVQGSVILRAAQQRSFLEKIKARPSIHLAWQFLASIPSGAPIRVVRYARRPE